MTFPDRLSVGTVESFDDQRVAPRFALMLRAARLMGERGEYLAIVRDVSETGVRLRLFHPLTGEHHLGLECATGESRGIEKVWERDGEAGFRFDQPIDVQGFIAEAGPFPKRPIRIGVEHLATITATGEATLVRLRNLSRQGAGIESDRHLALGQNLRITGAPMPEFDATVCWRRHPSYGVVFRQLMSLEELAVRAFAMQPGQQG